MTYQTKLEQLLEEFLNQFEFDPDHNKWMIYSYDDGPVPVNDELELLLDRANDLIYGQLDDDGLLGGEGYPTEEEE